MWWEGFLRYSKNYIPQTYHNVSVIPFTLRDKKRQAEYGPQLMTMYREFKVCHHALDLPMVSTLSAILEPVFESLGDLLEFVITDADIEFCGIFHEETLIGFISYRIHPGYCFYILDIWISPEFRGHGYFTNAHRLIRRIATVTKCEYMDLWVLVSNTQSYKRYIQMGYAPYTTMYTYVTTPTETPLDTISHVFAIVTLNKDNVKHVQTSFRELWIEYQQYKTAKFNQAGMHVDRPKRWNIKSILQERLKELITCQLFYYKNVLIGFMTMVKSNAGDTCSAQLNDLYFRPPGFEHFGPVIMDYIKGYLVSQHPEIKYVSTYAATTALAKRAMFEEAGLIHRADNLFLRI